MLCTNAIHCFKSKLLKNLLLACNQTKHIIEKNYDIKSLALCCDLSNI